MPPRVWVWWDLNTCWSPDGYCDLGRVRPGIESALKEHFNSSSVVVTIFAIGNLQGISPGVLKEMSDSGILVRHSPYVGVPMLFDVLFECPESVTDIMFISGSKSWCSHTFTHFGYPIIRVFPKSQSDPTPAPTLSSHEWVWETLLAKSSSPRLDQDDEPAWFCRLCKVPSQSCDDFINHLKSSQHTPDPSIDPVLFWLGKVHQQWLKYLECDSSEMNEYDEPLLCCRLCGYSGYDLHNMFIHLYSAEHAYSEWAFRVSPVTPPSPGSFIYNTYPAVSRTTCVWWDLNTCPLPFGYHITCVRPNIESALMEHFGPGPVTLFAIGNLDFVSESFLENLSSSGFLVRHDPDASGSEIYQLLNMWRKFQNPSTSNIMLISGNESWYSDDFLSLGFTMLYAFPSSSPAEDSHFLLYGSYKDWLWESLLEGNVETHSQIREEYGGEDDIDAFYCEVCQLSRENCGDFIKHLKGKLHKELTWGWLPPDEDTSKPKYFCKLCDYPCCDQLNLDVHLMSDGHDNKAYKEELLRREQDKNSRR